MNIHIDRFAYSPLGTFGNLSFEGFQCYTIEDPWKDNRVGVSCIPAGIYDLKPTRYNKGGYNTVEVVDVPDRSEIKIHVANTSADIQGCIGLGQDLGCLGSDWAVLSSRLAFKEFWAHIQEIGYPDKLIITNYNGGVL